MRFREPQDTETIIWTRHAKEKMRYYNLSGQRLKAILRNPQRIEQGVAPRTIAAMKPGRTKRPSEIWLMYQPLRSSGNPKSQAPSSKQQRIRIISAWRYPGISPIGECPVPDDILAQLASSN